MAESPPPMTKSAAQGKKVFDRYDKDKSGAIDSKEFRAMVKELGYALSDKEVELAIKMLSTDSKGLIRYEEFAKFWATDARFKALQLPEEKLAKLTKWQHVFDAFDKDKSGTLELGEFREVHKALRKTNLPLPENAEEVFRTIDKDNDHRVTFNEFTDYLLNLKGGM